MPFLSLLFDLPNQQTTIGSVPLDAVLTEDTELSAMVTDYPTEDGSVVQDHITRQPERLSMSGVVTGAGLMFNAGGRSKLIMTKEQFRAINESRTPITIVSGSDVYEDFAMTNAKISRSNVGEQLAIDCEFKKIRKVQLRTADIPPEKVAGTKGEGTKGRAGQTAGKGGKVSDATADKAEVPPSELSNITGWGA